MRPITRVTSLLRRVLALEYFQPEAGHAEPAIPALWARGRTGMVAVVGPNAAGKSVMRRIMIQTAHAAGVEPMHLSMEGRRDAETDGLAKLWMYGDETSRSTGQLSIKTVLRGIESCRAHAAEGKPHLIIWDEPDIGLADDFAAGMGVALAAFARTMPPETIAAVVISHRKALLQQLLPAEPHYLHLGTADPPPTLAAYLAAAVTPRPITELDNISEERSNRIVAVSIARREVRAKEGAALARRIGSG